jgi:hypothetical protein
MQNDWESKFYKELAEIKHIKEEIKKIHSDYKKLADSLLVTQRAVVRFMIRHDAAHYHNIVRGQKPEIARDFFNQATADASRMRAKARVSKDPISIYNEFSGLLDKRLAEANIKLTDLG